MKKITYLFLSLTMAVFIGSCSLIDDQYVEDSSTYSTDDTSIMAVVPDFCGTQTWNLTAGQHNDVGSIIVSNDETNLYVTYSLDYPGAKFGTVHLWVGTDLLNVPSNPQGTPVPGHFPYISGKEPYPSSVGLTEYTFTIPLTEIYAPANCGYKVYVVAHAEVDMEGDGEGDNETAFGGDMPGSGPRWWFYAGYFVECCGTQPPSHLETAFAKGGWVFVTDKKANPENLPSLNLIRNRWGWAINLKTAGTYNFDIWAGAGLNKTSNGTLVGQATIVWDGLNATVTYDLSGNNMLDELHIYAGDFKPVTIAPGQYGFTEYFDPRVNDFTPDTFVVTDTNSDGAWFILHAVVAY